MQLSGVEVVSLWVYGCACAFLCAALVLVFVFICLLLALIWFLAWPGLLSPSNQAHKHNCLCHCVSLSVCVRESSYLCVCVCASVNSNYTPSSPRHGAEPRCVRVNIHNQANAPKNENAMRQHTRNNKTNTPFLHSPSSNNKNSWPTLGENHRDFNLQLNLTEFEEKNAKS